MLDRRWRIEDWLERSPAEDVPARSRFNRAVPGPALGAIALAGLVVFSVVGCFAYYPSPQEIFKEMFILRGEVLTRS